MTGLEKEMVPRIVRWLRTRKKLRLPRQDLEDVSRAAVEAMARRNAKIANWPQACKYMCKAASTKALKRLRDKEKEADLFPSKDKPALIHTADPASLDFIRDTDFCEELEVFLNGLSREKTARLLSVIEDLLQGRFTLESLAEKLKMSVSTLGRRLRALRTQWSKSSEPPSSVTCLKRILEG